MTIDGHLDVLLAHDSWATDQILSAMRALSDEQLDRPFEMGLGSLRATIIHMIDAIGGWHTALVGTNDYQPLDPKASVDAIAGKHATVSRAIASLGKAGPVGDVMRASRATRSISAPRGVLVTHFLTHGTHHRAQALNMLRRLGVQSLPQSSVMQWAVATGAAEMVITEGKK